MADLSGFHWRDGWFFKRLEDGSVEVRRHLPNPKVKGATDIFQMMTIPAAEWSSIVCSVSKEGETRERWDAAQDFHGSSLNPQPKE